jgi:hypothetical protein
MLGRHGDNFECKQLAYLPARAHGTPLTRSLGSTHLALAHVPNAIDRVIQAALRVST